MQKSVFRTFRIRASAQVESAGLGFAVPIITPAAGFTVVPANTTRSALSMGLNPK